MTNKSQENSNNNVKTIFNISPINFWYRFFKNEIVVYFTVFVIFFAMLPLEIFSKILLIFILTSLGSLVAISKYRYFIFNISHNNNILIIEYLNWNKKKILELDLNTIIIEYIRHAFYRKFYYIINFKKKYDSIFKIEPEFRFAKYITQEILEDIFNKIIDVQNDVKNRNS